MYFENFSVCVLLISVLIFPARSSYVYAPSPRKVQNPSKGDTLTSQVTSKHSGWNCSTMISLSSDRGMLTSPNYPKAYPNSTNCIWYIKSGRDELIHIIVNDFQMEKGINYYRSGRFRCPFDFLYIFESKHDDESGQPYNPHHPNNWGSFCGGHVPYNGITRSPGSTLYFYFQSDSSRSFAGFNITYQLVEVMRIENRGDLPHHLSSDDISKVPPELEQQPTSEKSNMMTFLFGASIVLLCCIGFASVFRLSHFYAARSAARNNQRAVNWTSGNNDSDGSNQLNLPTPPPTYSDVVKTEEEWIQAVRGLGEESVRTLQLQHQAENVQVTYDLTTPDESPSSTGGRPNFSRMLSRVHQAENRDVLREQLSTIPTQTPQQKAANSKTLRQEDSQDVIMHEDEVD